MKNPNLLLEARILFLIMLLCAAIASVRSVHAATFTVTNTNDSGAGSLRQAILDTNALAGADTIQFSAGVTGAINLTTGELPINDDLVITGLGADQLSVSGNAASRVFHIGSGKTVAISGLAITNGSSGAGSDGGGIYNDRATLTISNCTLSGNSAAINGGAIINNGTSSGSATLTVNHCTLSGNSASFAGGGIINAGAGGSAMLTINNSALSGNLANGFGGSIFNDGSSSGNATTAINNSTLSGNSVGAGGSGGGIFNYGVSGNAMLTFGDTILNAGASGANIFNYSGTVTSLGYNLSSDNGDGYLTGTGDQINTDPMLGPLQDNGGPTFTHALLIGSLAIDAGDPNFTPPPNYDQRGPGYPRVVNGRIDIGAFEVQAIVYPQSQGYWKNNPDAWPVNSLTLGSQTYTKAELLTILGLPVGTGPKADASLILADQLIASKLNIANGADPGPVEDTIDDADAVLSLYTGKLPYRVRTNSTNGQQMVNDAAMLESFNKGFLTLGCSQ